MIKKIVALTALLALMFSAAGCVTVTFSDSVGGGTIQGEGEMTTVSYPCGEINGLIINMDFNNLVSDTGLKIYYTAEKSDTVTLEIQKNLTEYLKISNNSGTLTVDNEKSFRITDKSKAPKLYVSAAALEMLRIEGVVSIEKADKITADSFLLNVNGVCLGGSLELDVKSLNVNISGVSNITLNGTADKAVIIMSGVGNTKAFGLLAKDADVEVSGVGDVEISCSDNLNAEIDGIGGIKYKGNPNIKHNISGLGQLTKED